MRYDELYTRCRALCDRYIPTLASKYHAYAALRSIDNDPRVTQLEIESLTEYVGDYILNSHTIPTYVWCAICEFMVGLEQDTHSHCESCSLPCSHIMDECGKCEYCCEDSCFICSDCENHYDLNHNEHLQCEDCQVCHNCCNCNNEDDTFQPLPTYGKELLAVTKKDRINFDCIRLAGVEWEYNYVDSTKLLEVWKKRWGGSIHHDGSCGEEAVTPPMAGDYIYKVISELGEAFKNNAQIDNRCSVHVHVDARDYSWHDMFKLLKVYSKVEPVLYLLAGQQRLENIYCVPVGKDFTNILNSNTTIYPDTKGAVMALALGATSSNNARELQRQKPGKRTEGRRRGLNINPWLAARRTKSPDATVEFRMHRNTSDATRIIGWTKLCVRLVDWVAKSSQKEIDSLPNSPLRSLCQVIAPDCSKWILSRIKDWREVTKFASRYRRRIHIRGGKYEY